MARGGQRKILALLQIPANSYKAIPYFFTTTVVNTKQEILPIGESYLIDLLILGLFYRGTGVSKKSANGLCRPRAWLIDLSVLVR